MELNLIHRIRRLHNKYNSNILVSDEILLTWLSDNWNMMRESVASMIDDSSYDDDIKKILRKPELNLKFLYSNDPLDLILNLSKDEFNSLDDDIRENLDKLEEGDHGIKVFRAISISNVDGYLSFLLGETDSFKNGKETYSNLGIYWSFIETHAYAHWDGGHKHQVTIVGEMPEESIDIEQSLILWNNFTLGRDEAELRSIQNGQIFVNYVEIDGKTYQINRYLHA